MGKIDLPIPKIPVTVPPRPAPMSPIQVPDKYTRETTTPANNPQRRPPPPDGPNQPGKGLK